MITIENTDGRLSAWGKYADVKWIYWRKLPKNLPKTGGTLDLTGSIIEAEFDDGTTADVTLYCTFSPAEGTSIPADATNITVTAFYPARNGKTYEAPAELPVVHVLGIRVVTDEDFITYENYFERTPGLFDPDTMPFDKSKFSTWCLYGKGDDPEPIYAEKVENPSYTHEGVFYGSGGGYSDYYYVSANPNSKQDITVYHDITEPSEESFENAIGFKATATIDGVTYESNQSYIEGIPIDYFSHNDFPTVSGEHTLTSEGFIFHFADGSAAAAIPGLTDVWVCFSTSAPAWNTVTPTLTLPYYEGSSGSVWLVRRKAPNIITDFEYTKYNFSVTGGVVSWTREEES